MADIFDIQDEIATITLNRPDALNALSPQMYDDLREAFRQIKAEAGEAVKALILTGAGRAFCAGGDIKSMANNERLPKDVRRGLRSAHDIMFDLANIEVPVVALVDGPAAGAGCNIALAADFVLATPRAMFMTMIIRVSPTTALSVVLLVSFIIGIGFIDPSG